MKIEDRHLCWWCWLAFCSVLLAGLPIKYLLARRENETDQGKSYRVDGKTVERCTVKDNTNTKRFRISAYCPGPCCCGRFADGRTADNHVITAADYGRICAAPKSYPFGTIINIPGIGRVVTRDRGGSIKAAGDKVAGNVLEYDRLDILFKDHRAALNWGVKYLNCEVIEPK
jgi:3D (Asp-Asp-Asp) domain-containing protein